MILWPAGLDDLLTADCPRALRLQRRLNCLPCLQVTPCHGCLAVGECTLVLHSDGLELRSHPWLPSAPPRPAQLLCLEAAPGLDDEEWEGLKELLRPYPFELHADCCALDLHPEYSGLADFTIESSAAGAP